MRDKKNDGCRTSSTCKSAAIPFAFCTLPAVNKKRRSIIRERVPERAASFVQFMRTSALALRPLRFITFKRRDRGESAEVRKGRVVVWSTTQVFDEKRTPTMG